MTGEHGKAPEPKRGPLEVLEGGGAELRGSVVGWRTSRLRGRAAEAVGSGARRRSATPRRLVTLVERLTLRLLGSGRRP